ncbi:hypothetical protein [Helicobacter cappadocius]|uniref:Uncharacterized protein n=1 Tax=Helicobacter cappadocius TaxID=3063998 RepID=A0AA90PLS8_9HELI|nr:MULTISPECIES: hypothetical protein [unclassified Helicobacter]MDO7253928.1 hypothetical protein [Helicobacter sp. faydin-H75]MDP2539775.1 hypothetical protein [Helicobacter sp. faydin-H76]
MNPRDLEILKENLKTFLQVFIGKESETFFNSFMYFYQKLGDDSKIFFERLLEEADNIKNGNTTNIAGENFIKLFEEELKSLQKQESSSSIEEQKTIKNLEIGIDQIKQNLSKQNTSNEIYDEKPLKIFRLPMDWKNFEFNMKLMSKDILDKHTDELKDMNLYKEGNLLGTPVGIFAKDNLFSENKIKEFQKEYAKTYLEKLSKKIGIELEFLDFNANNDIILQSQSTLNQADFLELIRANSKDNNIEIKNLNWNVNIDEIKEFQKESKEFIDVFENEIKEVQALKNSNEKNIPEAKLEKQNNDLKKDSSQIPETPQYSSLLDFFEKKRIENQNLSISKDEFKKDFLHYCKTSMSEEEMKTLVSLYNKTPTKLTKEHKEMIEKGMRYNLINNNLLDKNLEVSIKTALSMPVSKKINVDENAKGNKQQIQIEEKNQTLSIRKR